MRAFIRSTLLLLSWIDHGHSVAENAAGDALEQSRSLRRRGLNNGDAKSSTSNGSWLDAWWHSDDDDHLGAGGTDGENSTGPNDDVWWGGNSTIDEIFDIDQRVNATMGGLDGNWTLDDFFRDDVYYGGADDDYAPMPFGELPIGAMSAMWSLFVNWTSSIQYGDLQCPSSDTANDSEPVCAATLEGDVGVWVCRSLINPFNGASQPITLCADGNQTIGEVDTCGCCDGSCPTVCGCLCTTFMGEDGVRVLINATMMGLQEPAEVCIDSKLAVSIVGGFDNTFACVMNCSAPMESSLPFNTMSGLVNSRFMPRGRA
jgi:hypothetical protein